MHTPPRPNVTFCQPTDYTGILGAGANNPATFLSGDNITLTGGNTTLNLFDFSCGAALPANTTVSGAQAGNKIIIADATQFNNTAITAANVTAAGGGAEWACGDFVTGDLIHPIATTAGRPSGSNVAILTG